MGIKDYVDVIVNSVPRLSADVFGNEWPPHPHHMHSELEDDDHPQYVPRVGGADRSFTGNVYWEENIRLIGKTNLRFDDSYRATHTGGSGDWTQPGIDLSAAPGEWQNLFDAAGGVVSLIAALTLGIQSGSDYWARDAGNGVLYPITNTDTLRVGQGSESHPSLAFTDHNNYGLMFEPSLDALAWTTAGQQRLRIYHEDDPWFRVNIEVPDSWDNNKLRINHDKATTASRFYYSGVSDVLSYYETIVKSPGVTSSYWYTDCTSDSSGGCTHWWEAKSTGATSPRSSYAYWVASSNNTAISELLAQGNAGTQIAGIYAIQDGDETSVWCEASTGVIYFWSTDVSMLSMNYTTYSGDPACYIANLPGVQNILLWQYVGSPNNGRLWLRNDSYGFARAYFQAESDGTGYALSELSAIAIDDYATVFIKAESTNDDGTVWLEAESGSDNTRFLMDYDFTWIINSTEVMVLDYVTTPAADTLLANGVGPSAGRNFYIQNVQNQGAAHTYIISESQAAASDASLNLTAESDLGESDVLIEAVANAAGENATLTLQTDAGVGGFGTINLIADSDIDCTAAAFYIDVTGEINFHDGYITASNYPNYNIPLAEAIAEYSSFYTNFGAVSIINAINQCVNGEPFLEENEIAFGSASDTITSSSELYYTGQVFSARAIATTSGTVASYLRAQNSGTGNSLIDINSQAAVGASSQILIRTLGGPEGAVINITDGGMLINTDDYLSLYAEDELRFEDENHTGSTWTQGHVLLSDSTDGWDDYDTVHGEVGLMEAIAHGGFVGRYVQDATSETGSSTTSTTFIQKLDCDFTATSGVIYKIEWYCEIGKTADTDVEARAVIGSTTMGEFNWKNQPYATRYIPFTGFWISDTLSGAQDLDLDYRVSFGGGTAYIRKARFLITRLN